jgi:hypothetical protein
MHEQNFEKGVRQQMEGFSLPPSPPVWAGVEAQIRRKRERRRILFWFLPVTTLLILATWLLLAGPKRDASKNTHQNKTRTSATHGHKAGNVDTDSTIRKADPKISQLPQTDEKKISDNGPETEPVKMIPGSKVKKVAEEERRSAASKSGAMTVKRRDRTKVNRGTVSKSSQPLERAATPAGSSDALAAQRESQPSISPSSTVAPVPDSNKVVMPAKTIEDSVAALADSTLLLPSQKKGQKKKIQVGVVFNFGSSGITTGLLDGFGAKALSDFSSGPLQNNSGGVPPLPPSAIRSGRYFTIGFSADYSIHKRLSASTGLQFQRLTTKLTVGSPGDSSNLAYRSGPTYYNNDSMQGSYTNAYHFVSLPIALRYQLHKKTPLFLSGGLIFSRLLSTNALHYSSDNNIYYRDSILIKKNAAGFVAALGYTLRLGKVLSLEVGPHFQYNLTPASKVVGVKPQHLYTVGIGSSLKFK